MEPPEATANDPNGPFGRRLRRAREVAGLTQEELAARAGLSAKAVGALERGERRHPYPSTVRALATALRLTEEEHAHLAGAVPPRGGVVDAGLNSLHQTLPTPRTSFIGRTVDVVTARGLLLDEAAPLLTLTGTGGVGKTRLALTIAHEVAPAYPDGVVFVDLAPLRDPDLVLTAIAQALGVRQVPDRSLLEVLIAIIRARRLLLILDNVEHLLSGAIQVVSLLEHCPLLQILATSRAPLRVRGEQLQPVAPLAVPAMDGAQDPAALGDVEAVALFVARARAANPSFALTEQNAPDVTALCHRLDGLPLALELAAAGMRFLPVDVLLGLLDVRLRVLIGGERDRPARQQTLHDAIAWSYDLLTPREQALFRRLAVFVGGVTLAGVSWIAQGDGCRLPLIPDAHDRLAALMDHGLVGQQVESDGEIRFQMLETVTEFALEQLSEHGETVAARHVLATWCQDVAARDGVEHLFLPDLVRRCQVLTAEHANFLAALDHLATGSAAVELRLAGSLGPFWATQGHHTIGRSCLERAVQRVAEAPGEVAAYALAQLGLVTFYQFDFDAGGAAISRAGEIDRAHGHRYRHLLCHLRSSMAMFSDDVGTAMALAAESAELSDCVGDDGIAGHSRFVHARLAVETGDLTTAESLSRQVLAAFPDAPYAQGGARLVFGWVATRRGAHAAALHEYLEALVSYLPVGDPLNIQMMLDGVAISLAFLGQAEAAARLFAAADRQRQDTVFLYRTPPEVADWERGIEQTRTALGSEGFAAAWSGGKELSLAAAVTEAVEVAHLIPCQASRPMTSGVDG
jgi:predicted ATPase/DNA-binding XRE family transcriptional regulator